MTSPDQLVDPGPAGDGAQDRDEGQEINPTVSAIMIAHTSRSPLEDEFMGGTWYHMV